MLLTCPNCETIFRVDSHNIKASGQAVRCSVCTHVWQARPGKDTIAPEPNDMHDAVRALRVPVILLVVFMGVVSAVAFNRVLITAYFPTLTGLFDVVGLTIRPNINVLAVTDLSATYSGDTLRLNGNLKNTGATRTHAADLRVTVTSRDGIIMNDVILSPEDDFIDAGKVTGFFVQLDVEQSEEANVTVTPLANRIYQ